MTRVVLRGVRGHLLRFTLTSVAVLLGVSFVAGTLVLTDTMDRSFTGIFEQANRGVDVVVRGTEAATSQDGTVLREQLPLELEEDLRQVDGVDAADANVTGSAVLVGAEGTAVRRGGAPALGFGRIVDDPAVELVAGREPTGPGEVLVEEATLAASGLAVGDSTTLVAGAEVLDVDVVGEVTFGALAGATLVFLDPATARDVFAPEGTVASFAVRGGEGTDQEALRDAIAGSLPDGAEAITGQQQTDEDTEMIREALGFISTFLLVFAGISLVVGIFLIFNTFAMLVAQRTRELALLRAMGASARQVVGVVVAEAFLVGLVGGALGLGVGVGLAVLLQLLLGVFGLEITGELVVQLSTVVIAMLVGVVVTVAAAVFPALRAARIAPVAAMRDDVALPERSLRVRALVGAVVVLTGLVGLWVALRADGAASGIGVAISALALFLGTAIAAPVVARPVLRVLAVPFAALLRPFGRLARENALRNPRRTATTASALMIGLALVSGVTVLSASTTASTTALVERQVTADLVLNAGFTGFPTSVREQAADVDGVASAAGLSGVGVQLDRGPSFAVAADAEALAENVDVRMDDGDVGALDDGQVLVNSSLAEDEDIAVGDDLTGTVGTLNDQSLEVGGVFEDNLAISAALVIPETLAADALPQAQRVDLLAYLTLEEGADPAAVREDVTEVVQPFVVVSVQDPDEFVSAQAEQTEQFLVIIYVLLALSVVIAVLGIINTLALSVVERTREIGLLRAVGMRRRQLAGTITIESVLTALFGAVLGTVLGLTLGIALQRALVDDGLTELAVPIGPLAVVFAVAGVVGVLAAVLPAIRAVRLDVLRAIATE